jgi:hypothetical protein
MALTPEQIEEALRLIVQSGVSSYSIGSRSVSKISPKELYELQQRIASDQERQSKGMMRLGKITRPSR